MDSAINRLEHLKGWRRPAAELLALVYIAIIAMIASVSGAVYVLFPELGALSHDVFTRPRGSWARAPLLLVITPVIAAAIGTLVTRHLPYGYLSVILTVGGALAAIELLRSPIAPAISAGLLPLVLGVKSWWYPPAIILGTALLVVSSMLWRQVAADQEEPSAAPALHHSASPIRPMIALMLFAVVAVFFVNRTHLRFILFPPLVVIGFEMFVHPMHCPWAARALRLPFVCFLAAGGGFAARHVFGIGPIASIVSMAWGTIVLRIFDLHVPPALAVALLPQVMDAPTILYPVSVGIGTSMLSACFVLYQRLRETVSLPRSSESEARAQGPASQSD
jgi:hypothetical protein